MDTAGKSALKLGNLTNFKVDTSKASKDIAPQSLEMLQTFVFTDYSRVKAKLMMLNNHRQEVEGIIQQY